MPKRFGPAAHTNGRPATPETEKVNDGRPATPETEKVNESEPLPLYPSQVDPLAPMLDHEPAMRWELAHLASRIAILENAFGHHEADENPDEESAPLSG